MSSTGRGGEGGRGPEAALEPTPAQAGGVQLVAHVRTGHRHGVAGRAVVVVRLGVGDQAEPALAIGDGVAIGVGAVDGQADAAGVTRNQVDRTRAGRSERGPERVVAHCELLGIVPQAGDGVAVVVIHDIIGLAGLAGVARAARRADRRHELVHGAAVKGLLLGVVVVVLIAGEDVVDVRGVEPAGVRLVPAGVLVGVVGQQGPGTTRSRVPDRPSTLGVRRAATNG